MRHLVLMFSTAQRWQPLQAALGLQFSSPPAAGHAPNWTMISFRLLLLGSQLPPLLSGSISYLEAFLQNITGEWQKIWQQQSHQETPTLRAGGQGRKCQWSEVSNILQFLIPELANFVTFNWSLDHLTFYFSYLKLVPHPIIFLIVYEDKIHNYIIFIEHSMFLEINMNYY